MPNRADMIGKKFGRLTYDCSSKKAILMHRYILGLNSDDTVIVDHIKHDTLDNRKENLRIGTQSDNMKNVLISSNNTSGIRGISYYSSRNLWSAEIHVNNEKVLLGQYKNFYDAVEARKDAEKKYFGSWSYDSSIGIDNL